MKVTVALHLLVLGLALIPPLGRASIEGSKHDFRSPGSVSATTDSLKDVCGFCHTPVGVETTPDGPLWSPQADEQTFGNIASFGTSNLEGNPMGPVSLTCLTCHDGTQASDASYAGGGFADGGTLQLVEGGLAVADQDGVEEIGHRLGVGGARAAAENDDRHRPADPLPDRKRGRDRLESAQLLRTAFRERVVHPGQVAIPHGFGLDYDGGFTIRRPIFAGKCFIDAVPTTGCCVVGIRPNAFTLGEGGGAAAAALHLIALRRKWGASKKGVGFKPPSESILVAGDNNGPTTA